MRGVHVNLHEEMHATLQVQPQIHFPGPHPLHPTRCGRRQIQCDDKFLRQGILDYGLGT